MLFKSRMQIRSQATLMQLSVQWWYWTNKLSSFIRYLLLMDWYPACLMYVNRVLSSFHGVMICISEDSYNLDVVEQNHLQTFTMEGSLICTLWRKSYFSQNCTQDVYTRLFIWHFAYPTTQATCCGIQSDPSSLCYNYGWGYFSRDVLTWKLFSSFEMIYCLSCGLWN